MVGILTFVHGWYAIVRIPCIGRTTIPLYLVESTTIFTKSWQTAYPQLNLLIRRILWFGKFLPLGVVGVKTLIKSLNLMEAHGGAFISWTRIFFRLNDILAQILQDISTLKWANMCIGVWQLLVITGEAPFNRAYSFYTSTIFDFLIFCVFVVLGASEYN